MSNAYKPFAGERINVLLATLDGQLHLVLAYRAF